MDGRRLEESLELAHRLVCQVNRLLHSEVRDTFGAMIKVCHGIYTKAFDEISSFSWLTRFAVELIQRRLMKFLVFPG